ncbi:MAG: GNAT family N-acetyltransferase [Oscillospiraceae bacterium]|nr:GNAT family N-acetyltransferase [Oscillospiraceae bacterium]
MIRIAEKTDVPALAKLASAPDVWCDPPEELEGDFAGLLASEKDLVAVAEKEGRIIGFANIRLRTDYVAGTKSSPVAYLEGIAVAEEFRGKGTARALFEFCQSWAKEKGCTEFGSDCLITNEASYAFHMALGFKEIERTVHFAKKIEE